MPGFPPATAAPKASAGTGTPLRALLFDLDGTLIDSMPLHQQSWRLWFAELGLPFDEAGFFEATAGRTNHEILTELFPQRPAGEIERLADRKEALYRVLAEQSLQCVPGAADLCRQARASGLKLAICTAAPALNIELAFRRFGLAGWIDTLTSPADGLRGKPHPDIFLAAAERLGVTPGECLVFEDAPLGIEAARRAGMAAVALTTTLPATAFHDQTHLIDVRADFVGYKLPVALPPIPGA